MSMHYIYANYHTYWLYGEPWASLARSPPGRSRCSKPSCALAVLLGGPKTFEGPKH